MGAYDPDRARRMSAAPTPPQVQLPPARTRFVLPPHVPGPVDRALDRAMVGVGLLGFILIPGRVGLAMALRHWGLM